ncbi:emerin homolog 1-like isoform X2 [Mizuhopecten yessoensis]|uniref:emerin homolog 1-like isoform X2 n=1 Tax=Mizuhopecten yessoensis TaxID=6573 RepID=UPI000B45C704|nr:emerin homolog 1-like isoform X2 [Mizuhopecten yessoensis]
MSDPSLLTKAKLKEELIRHNIPLPKSDARKQSYIDLYTEHVLKEDSEDEDTTDVYENEDQQSQSGESDSEIVFKKPTYQNSTEAYKGSGDFDHSKDQDTPIMMSVKDLTDAELTKELRSRGAAPGPVTATTRKVYEKKLLKLRQAEGSTTEKLIETSQYEEVPDDEERSPPPKPRTPVKRATRARKVEPDYMGEETTITHRTPTQSAPKPEPAVTSTRTSKTTVAHKTSTTVQHSALPRWVKFLVFVGVFFFAYLVYINMEPSGSRVPKIAKGPAS